MDLVLTFVVLAAQLNVASARISFCERKYVAPGSDFSLECGTVDGVITRIYSPKSGLPSDDDLRAASERLDDNAFTADATRIFTDYTDASEEDEGWYTCIENHREDPIFDTARCEVIVTDLCEDVECPLLETCFPDYDSGSYECRCDLGCSLRASDVDFLCTDRCEIAFHECAMQELICEDKLPRTVLHKGFCPTLVQPTVRTSQRTSQVIVDVGELVTLSAGLLTDGVPSSTIIWLRNGEELEEAKNLNELVFTAAPEWEGIIKSRILHCLDETTAIVNTYNVEVKIETTATPTAAIVTDHEFSFGALHVCSVFPGGVVEQFDGSEKLYDLACTHVLAANFMVDGDYSKSFYIYGTFDEHDGKKALSAMTFYIGRTGFEFQRGWLINVDGEKFEIEEDVKREVGDSGCYVTFSGLHLRAECPYFLAYYDGVMAGHIRLGDLSTPLSTVPPLKSQSSLGLCWDNNSGFRTNWQLQFTPRCSVSPGVEPCPDDHPNCSQHPLYPKRDSTNQELYEQAREIMIGFSCGNGATLSCSELNCGGNTPTPAQQCALNRADKVSCHLRMKFMLVDTLEDDACPEDECDWELDVLSRGCPQENPPFKCGDVDI